MADTDTDQAPTQPPPQLGVFGQLADWAKQGAKTAFPAAANLYRAIERVPPAGAPAEAPPPPPMPGQPVAPPAAPVVSQQTVASSYIPPRAVRPGSELGKPWWPVEATKASPGPPVESQHVPGGRDSYRYAGQVAARQAKFGAPAVAGPAQQVSMLAAGFAPLFDLISRGAFSQGFSEGNALQIQKQLGALKVQQEQFVLQTEMMHQAHQDLLLQYGDVFAGAEAYVKSGGKEGISPEEAEFRIGVIAGNNGDTGTQQALHDWGYKGALSHLQREDTEMRTAMAASTSLKKAKETAGERTEAEEGASLGYKTDISGQGMDPGFNFPGLEGGQQAGEQTAQADTGTATDAGEGEDEADPQKAFEEEEQKKYSSVPQGITQEVFDRARDTYNGDFDPKSLKSGTYRGLVENVAGDLKRHIEQAARGPDDTETKLARIAKLDPTAADKARGLLELRLDPEKDIPAAHQARENLTTLASTINPHWKTSSFALAKQYEQLNQPSVRTINRVASFLPAVNSLNSDLLAIPEDQKIPASTLKKVYANTWSGDPTYTTLYTDIQNVLNETSSIQSGTGRPTVTNVKMRAQEMLNTMSPAQIRAQLLRDAQASYGMVKNIENQYKATVGDPNAAMPFFPKQVEADYKAIMRMNPYTGEMPDDASGAVKATSKKGGAHPSWLNTNPNDPNYQAWKPLIEKQVIQGRLQIKQLEQSGNAVDQANAQRIRRRLGEFATAQPGDPDYAE